ncbi:MAG: thioesterase family protein, partial [Luteibaculum sp.]
EVQVAEISRVGFELIYRVSCADKDIAVAKTGMVCFDYKNKKVMPVPPSFVALAH